MTVVLVDDLRDFRDSRPALIARSSAEALRLLERLQAAVVDELWLDHDLGPADDIGPVVAWLEEQAFLGRPFDARAVLVHTANPVGAERILRGLRRWGYACRRAGLDELISAPLPEADAGAAHPRQED